MSRNAPRRSLLGRLLWAGSWVLLAALAVVGWPVQFGGHTGYTIVAGHSMNPLYATGDLLVTRAQARYRRGQIVVYGVPGGGPAAGYAVVHRLVGGSGLPGGPGWVTKGDNNPSPDIWTPSDTDIRGTVVLHLAKAGFVLSQVRNPLLFALVGAVVIGKMLWPVSGDEGTTQAPAGTETQEVAGAGEARSGKGLPGRRRRLADSLS